MTEPGLGAFRFDPEFQYHESTLDIDGAPVAVRATPEAFADRAELGKLISGVVRAHGQILDQVVDDLLEDKNEGWLREGEAPLSDAEFRSHLSLEAIEIGSGGKIELLLGDDGMFWGHQIVVKLDSDFQLGRVDLEG